MAATPALDSTTDPLALSGEPLLIALTEFLGQVEAHYRREAEHVARVQPKAPRARSESGVTWVEMTFAYDMVASELAAVAKRLSNALR